MQKFKYSYEMYDHNLIYVRWLADVCGVDMMVENYKINYRTVATLFLISFTVVNLGYSCWFHYPNWHVIMELMMVFSFCLQGANKFYNAYIHRHFFILMYGRLRNLHYKYQHHRENNAQLLLLMQRIHLISKGIFVLFGLGACSYFIYPVFNYWRYRRLELLISVRLPGIDADSHYGYIITMAYQIFMMVAAVFGMAAADSAILLFVCSLAGFVDVFKNELRELDMMLVQNPRDESKIRRKVREICVQHFTVIEYESDLDERYFTTCFVQVVSTTIGLSGALFLAYIVRYIPGFALMLVLTAQLLEFCLLGTVLYVKNEEITEAIYGTSWHLMEKPQQRCFALMLHKSQNFVEMTVGGLAPLNMETFVAIMKSIYSYFTMLISFIK
ncbi:AAEL006465-PA [Aedes aegypti]|uniref:Odorant receptor n=2 Tax=Aedes aegypti TaxID=7159 RepID=Q176A1_AEDAE|nr:AAEL006465-PA [Aedes aegypti]DAA80386.1 TPA_exp: odorant receptor 44 [Aedes aegypti]